MNVFLLSEIFRPAPGRVRPYPDASHPRSGERGRIIRRQNPMSTLFQKNFFTPFFSVFPNNFPIFLPPPLPRTKNFFAPAPPFPPLSPLPFRPRAIPVLSKISKISKESIISTILAHFPRQPFALPPSPRYFPNFLENPVHFEQSCSHFREGRASSRPRARHASGSPFSRPPAPPQAKPSPPLAATPFLDSL